MRVEKDLIGELNINNEKNYGIHTVRAMENFGNFYPSVHIELIKSMALVKLAASRANLAIGKLDEKVQTAIETICIEIYEEKHNNSFPLNAT